mgnify:CR=1 FL=1|tara:strand:+ start:7741 stop:8223 length:483 start_codon:yes stop_codon:yes gene_type:complete
MQNIRLRSLILLVTISIILTIDYLSKKSIEAIDHTIILNSFITLYKVNNTGVAFSIFDTLDNRGLLILNLIIISILIIVIRELYSNMKKSLLYIIGLAMIFAGGLGNLIDRFDNNSVTDFISIHIGDIYFPAIFNLADVSISFGALLIIIYFINEKNEVN